MLVHFLLCLALRRQLVSRQATHLALRDGHGTRVSDTHVLGISSIYRFVFQDDHVRGRFGAAQVDLFNEAATTFYPYGRVCLLSMG